MSPANRSATRAAAVPSARAAGSTPGRDQAPDASPAGMVHLLGTGMPELERWLTEHGHDRYRAAQILDWVYAKGVERFDQMTNLPKATRTWLTARAAICRSELTREALARDGTRKLLLTWPDGAAVESVWIPARDRHTACLSSQVGCPVGCRFCASGLDGVQRSLTAGEIVEQALRIRRLIADRERGGRLSNIVLMGMGEPLANYDAVVKAIRIINAPWGLAIGARKITLSTVGLPKQIRRLAHEDLQLNLAWSLHAPDDELRRELIPWSKGGAVGELIDACRYYFEQTGRELTLEYVLLGGLNDHSEHADRLADIAHELRANVNLLRYNPVPGLPYRRPSSQAACDFQERLRRRGVNAHVRSSRGQDVNAACGQLRRSSTPVP